ncbi:MAG: helix-turn-helix transcriptional regulator, partial [Acidobacteriota bacterium]
STHRDSLSSSMCATTAPLGATTGDKNMNNASEMGAISVEEAARLAGIGRATLWALIAAGDGPASLRVGRRRLIRRQALEAWLRELEAAEAARPDSDDGHDGN